MVLVDQDRLQTIPDPTGLAFRIVADGHHSGEVVGCACGGAAVSAWRSGWDHAKGPTENDQWFDGFGVMTVWAIWLAAPSGPGLGVGERWDAR